MEKIRSMNVISDVSEYQQRKLNFDVHDEETLEKICERYLKAYLRPGRKVICVKQPNREAPLLGEFSYSFLPNGCMSISIQAEGEVGIFFCRACDTMDNIQVIKDTGLNHIIRKFVISYIVNKGVLGNHNCRLYDTGVGPQFSPVIYWP